MKFDMNIVPHWAPAADFTSMNQLVTMTTLLVHLDDGNEIRELTTEPIAA